VTILETHFHSTINFSLELKNKGDSKGYHSDGSCIFLVESLNTCPRDLFTFASWY